MKAEQSGHDLVDRVAALLREQGRGPAATALLDQRDTKRTSTSTVVVVGEDKRGKSSLVNALLAAPDLSPVGAKVVTGSPITFEYSVDGRGEVSRYGSDRTESTTVEQARRLATVDGNPGNAENVRAIRIGVDRPLLRELTIVDTPGVGGLASGHAELTLQSLVEADALLFVVDASGPLRAAELAFLRRAAGRVQAVVLVVTKTDVNPGWRTIVDDDAALLAEHAPRFGGAPICPVSSTMALRALATGDDEFIAEIRAEAGLTELESLLRTRVFARLDSVRLQNVLRGCITTLATLERDLRERQAALAPDGRTLETLQRERARLRDIREDKVTVPARLEAEIRKLTLARQDLCARRILDIRLRYQERMRNARREDFNAMPWELQAELTALGGDLNAMAAQQLAQALGTVLDEIDQQSLVQESLAQLDTNTVVGQLAPFVAGSGSTHHGDRMALLNSVSTGRSLMSLVGGTSAAAFLAPPFGLVLGLGLGGLFAFHAWRDKGRRDIATEFGAWLNEQVTNAQLTINNGFALQAVDLQSEMRAAIRRALNEREAEIAQSVEAAQSVHRQGVQEQNRTKDQWERQLRTSTVLRNEAARLLRQLEAAAP